MKNLDQNPDLPRLPVLQNKDYENPNHSSPYCIPYFGSELKQDQTSMSINERGTSVIASEAGKMGLCYN